MWHCKACPSVLPTRSQILKHFRVKHTYYGNSNRFPCVYESCSCSFRTWNALLVHLSRFHVTETNCQTKSCIFSCHLCPSVELISERLYWSHINAHLKKNELVSCMFLGCSFQTNICGTFKSHKSRTHSSYSLKDFKPGVVTLSTSLSLESAENISNDCIGEADAQPGCSLEVTKDFSKAIENSFAAALFKLEFFNNVPSTAISDFLLELHHLSSSFSQSHIDSILVDIFQKHQLQVDKAVRDELTFSLSTGNPINKAIAKGGPLSSAYQRKQYYKANFNIVEPVEYILNAKENKTVQYVPILASLQVLLNRKDVVDKIVYHHEKQREAETATQNVYRSFRDGLHFKGNNFLSDSVLKLSLGLYIDDFEVCNPLGTSRKTHKLCAVYWVLCNLPPGSHSSLSSIYLAILCKTDHVKLFGYDKVLEPLLNDLRSLEVDGIFVPQLGRSLKGTVKTVAADNLGAHALAGFVENFTGPYYCRFCTATGTDIASNEVRSGVFSIRTKEIHETHVRVALDTGNSCFGVKRACPLTKALSYFHVVSGYPPDIAHDLLEGIVPVEIACCLSSLISKKYITLEDINVSILHFPYKWMDKTNKPHILPNNLSNRKSIGGNAHENWNLLRLLPFLIGPRIPEHDPAWQVLLDLKQIVELVVAPVHNDESIAYLETKISDHRQRYQEVFPEKSLMPKHHYLEHYPQLIRFFGPLVELWTIRFEAKHSFFKKVIKHTSCFKNVPLTLAVKHQFVIGYHLSCPNIDKPILDVSDVCTVPLDCVKEELAVAFRKRDPSLGEIQLARNVWSKGINYRIGMVVAHGSEGGLSEFGEIQEMSILNQRLFLVLKLLCGWYNEHYGAYELTPSPTRELAVVDICELTDEYPLAAYLVGCVRMVTLKRSICV